MSTKPFPVTSFQFWKAYLVHCRPYLFFVSGVAGLSGMALAGGNDAAGWRFWMAFVPFFLGYGLGQALTDTFQIDTDRLSAPYRPLSQGIVTPEAIRWVSLVGLFLCGASLVLLNWRNLLFAVLTISGLATYTYFKKNFWFGGPPYNAWIVALLPLTGFMAASGGGFNLLNNSDLILLALLSFFSYANFVLMGYLKDISADRATGYHTFPVTFGWNATVWVGDVLAALSMLLAFLLVNGSTTGLIFVAIGSAIAIAGQLFAHLTSNKSEHNARFPIEATVRGFLLWHLAVIVSREAGWLIAAVLFYIAFEAFLHWRPERSQI
jgi:4-hydroxybenzoate polyprenyltransferase